jgi:hypothetical protein
MVCEIVDVLELLFFMFIIIVIPTNTRLFQVYCTNNVP